MKKMWVSYLLWLISFALYAGPFGLEKGMSLEQVTLACNGKEPELLGDDRFIIFPQKTHPYFEAYVAWISETEGLYYLKAKSIDIETSRYGTELKRQFESIEQSISKTYGEPSRTDEIHPDSSWDEPDSWMFALSQGDRTFYSVWTNEEKSSLPDSINGIALSAEATSSTSGYIVLEYEFDNHEKVEERENSAF